VFASSASVATLKKRAHWLHRLRAFFYARNCWEVDVPVLGEFGVTDLHLEPICAQVNQQLRFLQTSPEFFMKRLLAQGSGDIFYLGKAFRQDEQGPKHRPEFTLLEWYRCGYTDQSLIEEIRDLLLGLAPNTPWQQLSYGELFERHLGLDPHGAQPQALASLALQHLDLSFTHASKSTWLDLLFSCVIEPLLPAGICVVTDYPACQSALARLGLNAQGQTVARRFEVFWSGVELANGYWELTDVQEQAARFAVDQQARAALGRPAREADPRLLAALQAGMPACAGVALGVDRLIMALENCQDIAQVVPFAEG
jgi:elongation factor P--(R)-beta-lysine ligase